MTTEARGGRLKTLLRRALSWTAVSLLLHLAWESAQLPLYTIWRDSSAAYIAYAVVHCTAGDGLIAAATFLASAVLLQNPDWVYSAPLRGVAIVLPLGIAYTAYSEWRNVYEFGSWAYMRTMPLVFGIGSTPLLQWLVVPLGVVLLLRRFQRHPGTKDAISN